VSDRTAIDIIFMHAFKQASALDCRMDSVLITLIWAPYEFILLFKVHFET
jgi:hypothetical protein